ncbi:MAG: DNA polymerase III subunit alpha, partial [Actinomycetota bacterium]
CKRFDILSDLGYVFPDFQREAGEDRFATADEALKSLCEEALAAKYHDAPPERQVKAREWLQEELRLVKLHGLGGFFLVYRDLLQLSKQVAAELRGATARGRFELPPGRGRGSAVSSIICYLIGLSPVDPVKAKLFPGRFLNESLSSVPDIDLDFPRDIRAELIRRVHERYGNDHVAMVNIMPTYRFRGAVREVGKALALPPAELDRLAKLGDGYTPVSNEMDRHQDFAAYAENPLWAHLRELSRQLWGMPRHVSQHVGGIIISSRPLIEVVPLERSAMEGRQVCQWDKDSCDTARMIKIDFLALGMLSAVEECLELIAANHKPMVDLSRIEFDDPHIYNRICRGQTVGSFQIESRAQIGMLVRTRPRNIEDLAVQVAIVRPGPIVGNAVNPYVRRREDQRCRRSYKPPMDHPLLEPVLGDTLGIIIYQDQVMEVCKALAGFTDGEADQLRRAMSRKRSRENMEKFRELFLNGALERGVPPQVAARVFEQVVAFSAFGFPKSHAAAFAILAYQSMWLLHYHPAEFVASVLNNQPMGFYPRDTLVQDAKRRGVAFLAPDINLSERGCTVSGRTVRLGLGFVGGVGDVKSDYILAERRRGGPYRSLPDYVRRVRLPESVGENLILVGAFDRFGMNRRELLWQLGLLRGQGAGAATPPLTKGGPGGVSPTPDPHPSSFRQGILPLPVDQDQVSLPGASAWERMAHDYRLLSLSVEGHPMQHLRPLMPPEVLSIRKLRGQPNGETVTIAGIVTTRQRPETAKGILFLLVEDETGTINVVVRKEIHEAHRELYRAEPFLILQGRLDRREGQHNLVAEEAWSLLEVLPDPVKSAGGRRGHQAIAGLHTPRPHNFR